MKKMIYSLVALCALLCAPAASAFDLKDLTGLAGNLVEGVLTKSDIEVKDMAGTWTSSGSAVAFKSESALAKAGGVATAAAIESQIDPYFKKYGLTGAVLTVDADGSFTFQMGKLSLTGTITKVGKGEFEFAYRAGMIPLGSYTTYVQKSPGKLEVMFDATKLKSLVSSVAKFTGNSMATTLAKLLDSYDGMLVGFSMSGSGAQVQQSVPSGSDSDASGKDSGASQVSDLINVLKNKKKKN